MITPLTITSLNQGKELARRQVEKLYGEPAEPVLHIAVVEEVPATESAPPKVYARHSQRPSLVAQFLAVWNSALPIGVRRL